MTEDLLRTIREIAEGSTTANSLPHIAKLARAAMMPRDTQANPTALAGYVEISPVVMEGFPDAHNVFLRVWSQSFCVTPHGCETREAAEWTRDMLARALTRIVQECGAAAANLSAKPE